MSSRINFTIAQGDDLEDSFVATLRRTGVVPTSDLTKVEFLVKNSLRDADGDAVLTSHTDTATTLTIDDANAWTFTILAAGTITLAMAPGRYKCVCTTVDAAGKKREAFRGDFILTAVASDPAS